MKKTISIISILMTCILLLQNVSAGASPISSCTTISSSGEYQLTKDLFSSSSITCIDITADNVVLDCQNYTIEGVSFMKGEGPMYGSSGIQITRNNPTNTKVTIKNCVVQKVFYGIYLKNADNNTLDHNTIRSNTKGIMLYSSSKNKLSGNKVSDNSMSGMWLEQNSNNNTLFDNVLELNTGYGLWLYYSSKNNLIYNNFFNNMKNALDQDNNFWNTTNHTGTNIIGGPNIGGNYFSDYTGTDTDGDGFGESPYNIPYSGVDNLPLAIPEVPTIFLSIGMMFLSLFRMKRALK
ncbi:MAG: right-handed parallel beta-helix repeat-containing protein [Candidatus Aenigmarchaeota archaeon]|nr:right-handed parallel beta-helix repeat-containing protein [Candidatus Aenigmarchaeota archaeon]